VGSLLVSSAHECLRSTTDQRLEEARAHEQAEDFQRQEKILKLISTELTRNTTRVVEMAVKNEVQNSVLPSLENITKNEVKAALNDQVGRGISDNIQQVCCAMSSHRDTTGSSDTLFRHSLSKSRSFSCDPTSRTTSLVSCHRT
jgi:transcriptional accessory protein Tex/SPT6